MYLDLNLISGVDTYVRTIILRTMEAMDKRELKTKEAHQDNQLSNTTINIKATPKGT
jgi:hypothetical protein